MKQTLQKMMKKGTRNSPIMNNFYEEVETTRLSTKSIALLSQNLMTYTPRNEQSCTFGQGRNSKYSFKNEMFLMLTSRNQDGT